MRQLGVLAAVVAAAVLLVACGGHQRKPRARALGTARAAGVRLVRQCPPGSSHAGCAILRPQGVAAPRVGVPAGCMFPDVYEGQGTVDWGAVKAWERARGCKPAAIFKLGEFRVDFQAARNAAETARLGFWRAGYWFVRNTGVAHELAQIVAEAHATRVRIVALDEEVPEAAGYDAPLTAGLRNAGLLVVTYSAPGTWPGGSFAGNPAWIATFGSHFGCLPWSCKPVAWQCSDGVLGCVTSIPGIGRDDVNVDLGITTLGAPPADPLAFLYKPRVLLTDGVSASEHNTAATWLHAGCRNPVRRSVCKSSLAHLRLLSDRVFFLANHRRERGRWVAVKAARWDAPNGQIPYGPRFAFLTKLENQH